ncbi:MAG: PIF1 family DEAD/DEAH box helicase [Candidatus Moraniibacteriota bacterium]
MTQETALNILKLGKNVFLTGPAGSGKTFVLNRYIQYLRRQKIEVAVTASTGIAATHMNGVTIHSWSGLGIRDALTEREAKDIAESGDLVARYRKTKVLIIDEVSMLDANRLDAVEKLCRAMKDPFLPFGGLQVVLCGDFFQLPPVNKGGETIRFAFESAAWQSMGLKICYLEEQHRHEDDILKHLLNAIRTSKVTDDVHELLQERAQALDADDGAAAHATKLFTHNTDVDLLNNRELLRIDAPAYAYTMKHRGKRALIETLQKNCLAPERLVLKAGAQVMFVKNNFDAGYVNGTLGRVVRFDKETKMPIVETFAGREVTVISAEWQLADGEDVVAAIEQLPLRLAWAVTVHKSQGMSLDAAEIDLRKSFEYGMGYVALSRVRRLSGLFIRGINTRALEVHPTVRGRDEALLRDSFRAAEEFAKLTAAERTMFQTAFAGRPVRREKPDSKRGGNERQTPIQKARKKHPHAYTSWSDEEDKILKREYGIGKKMTALAVMFSRTEGAVRARLKKLGLKK